MSIHSRDYMRDDSRRPSFGGPATWSVVTRLILLNLAVYVLNNLVFFDPQRDFLGLSLEALKSFRVWTPLTYQFVHANLWHLLANLVGLFFIGRMLLELVPPRQVALIYLFGGFAGGALQLLWNAIFGPDAIIVGASGSVLALAFALISLVPYRRLQLLLFFLLPVNLTMRQLGWVLLALNAALLLFGSNPAGGERVAVMAHFGGILWGWAHIRLGWHERRSLPARPPRPQRPQRSPLRKTSADQPSPGGKKEPFVTSDVDAILDKINEHGFQSLTDEERRVLEQSSRRLSRRLDGDS